MPAQPSTPSLGAEGTFHSKTYRWTEGWTTIRFPIRSCLLEVQGLGDFGPLQVYKETEDRLAGPRSPRRRQPAGERASRQQLSRIQELSCRPEARVRARAPSNHPRGAQALGSSEVLASGARVRAGGGSRTSDPGRVAPPRRLQRPAVPRTHRSGRKCHSRNSVPPGPASSAGRLSPRSRRQTPAGRSLARGPHPGRHTHQVVHRGLPARGPSYPQGRTPSSPRRALQGLRARRSCPDPGPAASASHHVRHHRCSHPEPVPPRSARCR